MSSRPRQSVLKLFDPLSTPARNTSSGLSKENATPRNTRVPGKDESASETVFFKRTYSRSKNDCGVPPVPPLPKEFTCAKDVCLIEVEDEMEVGEDTLDDGMDTIRKPLGEINKSGWDNMANGSSAGMETLSQATTPLNAEQESLAGHVAQIPELSEQSPDLPIEEDSPDNLETLEISTDSLDHSSSLTITLPNSLPQTESCSPPSVNPQYDAPSPDKPSLPIISTTSTPSGDSSKHTRTVSDGPICFFLPGQEKPASPPSIVNEEERVPGLSVRRSSFDLHNSWKLRAQNTSVDLINDEMSFLSGVDDSSFLDHSREEGYISRFGGHALEGTHSTSDNNTPEITPNTSVDSDMPVDNCITAAPESHELPTMPSPSRTVLGKRLSPPRSPSPVLETPKSSPISKSITMAPTKKALAFRSLTEPGLYSKPSESRPPQPNQDRSASESAVTAETKLAKIQPLFIKKKHKPSASVNLQPSEGSTIVGPPPSLASSTTNSTSQRKTSSSSSSSTTAPPSKPVLPPGRGGARRVPLSSSAAAPLMKQTKPEAPAQIRKGPQRPPVPIPLSSSTKSMPVPKIASKTVGGSAGVPKPTTAPGSSSLAASSVSASRLPKPQIKSRIPGPSAGPRKNL